MDQAVLVWVLPFLLPTYVGADVVVAKVLDRVGAGVLQLRMLNFRRKYSNEQSTID